MSVWKRGTGSGGRAGVRRRTPDARRPKPHGPDAPAAHHRDMAAGLLAAFIPRDGLARPGAVGRRWTPRQCEKGTAPERSAHRGSYGASLKHRARDAGDFWRTCGYQTEGPVRGRAASAPRGAEARGSDLDPASPSPSRFRGREKIGRRCARRRKNFQTTGRLCVACGTRPQPKITRPSTQNQASRYADSRPSCDGVEHCPPARRPCKVAALLAGSPAWLVTKST